MAEQGQKPKTPTMGQYYLMEKVAQGGMAEIYRGLAYDVHGINQKTVCIKKILPHLSADRDFIGSITEEAKLAVRLVHGNIAQTYDLGKVDDDYYMVMEYVEGATLSQIHKRCQARGKLIPVPIVAYFISEALGGLDYMHRRTDEHGVPLNIVHRDVSPQNIMVSFSGTVKLIDFGIAKAAFKVGQTDSGMLKGKFAYMSPEQAFGEPIDHRSDLFSLGVILHELLTGKRLFKAADSRQTIRNVRNAQVDPPASMRSELPDELDRITMRALAKDRRRRYPYASEMRDDLVKFLHSAYPDFKTSDAAAFLQELFKDEINRPRQIEADSKTPALIIDRTNSALAGEEQFEVTGKARAPVDMKEFELEDDSEEQSDTDEREPASPSDAGRALPEIESEETGKTARTPFAHKSLLRKAAAVLLVGAMVTAAVLYLQRERQEVRQRSAFAELMVVTDPADAAVLIDGKVAGSGSPVTVRSIDPEQEHLLRVSREGFLPHESVLQLKQGEFASISVRLTASTAPTGSIDLTSTPPGAAVFINDSETRYRTPATIPNLAVAGPVVVGLYLPGYKFWTKSVQLKNGETKSFDVEMARNFGSVVIHADPPQSLVMIDGVPVGQAPATREDLEPDRVYRVEVWHEGYQPTQQEFKAEAGKRSEVRVTLTPAPPSPEPPKAEPPPPPKPAQPSPPMPMIEEPATGAPAAPAATTAP